ncbi:ABC transporter C-terminal domain-containing protein [Modestobacter sp. NPDC049651]|uniref:ABC transporter C-terminal domain-containing protein n=1 Tax=unclassified Modestobacter TaxID=2643866 RepID=UPI0033EAE266
MELQLLLQAVRRSFLPLLVVVLVGAAAGALGWYAVPASYQASAVLVTDSTAVTVPGQEPFSGDPERYVTGELESLRSYSAAAAAGRSLDPSLTARQVLDALELSHVTGSDVVTVVARADSPGTAVGVANAVADTYLDRRAQAARAALDGQREALEAQSAQLTDRLADPGVAGALATALQAQYAQVTGELAELDRPGVLRDATRVVDQARGATLHRPFSLLAGAVGAAVLAGLLGVLAAVVVALRRPRVAGVWQLEELTGRPVDAVFRHVRRTGRGRKAATAPARRLVALLESRSDGARPWVVTVCDAGAGRGRAVVFAAVARRLAEEGRRVVAVSPWQDGGLLAGDGSAAHPGDEGWRVGAGALPGLTVVSHDAPDALTSVDFGKGLPDWSADADVVLVDAGSLVDSSFAGAAARAGGQAVLVVPVREQAEADLRLGLDLLATAGDVRVHVAVTTP